MCNSYVNIGPLTVNASYKIMLFNIELTCAIYIASKLSTSLLPQQTSEHGEFP